MFNNPSFLCHPFRFSVRVNNTDVFHVDRRFWTSFRSRFPATGPRERAFHSATVIGNYMVVYGEPSLHLQSTCFPLCVLMFPSCVLLPGGNVHIHYQEEKCYDEEIFFYHLGCHQWVSSGERWPTSEFLLTVTMTEFIPICSPLTSFFFPLSSSLRRGRCKGAVLACCCCHGGPGAAGGRGLQRRRPRRPGGIQSSSFCQQ